MPIGMPGWPLFAAWTASIDSARMALASSLGSAAIGWSLLGIVKDRSDADASPFAALLNRRGAPVNLEAASRLAGRNARLYGRAMPDNRALAAIERIEQALGRIEAAASPRAHDELRRLRAVHEALRGKVEGAIASIDRLIDGAGPR
jgi:prephenate dehydrogenase